MCYGFFFHRKCESLFCGNSCGLIQSSGVNFQLGNVIVWLFLSVRLTFCTQYVWAKEFRIGEQNTKENGDQEHLDSAWDMFGNQTRKKQTKTLSGLKLPTELKIALIEVCDKIHETILQCVSARLHLTQALKTLYVNEGQWSHHCGSLCIWDVAQMSQNTKVCAIGLNFFSTKERAQKYWSSIAIELHLGAKILSCQVCGQ